MEAFYAEEDRDGVRFSFNVWPSQKTEFKKIVAPFGAMYTPLKRATPTPQVQYDPVACPKCTTVLNPYAKVDFNTRLWQCPICLNRNQFPAHYAGISETSLPAELMRECTTLEYRVTNQPQAFPPVFLFLIDTAIKHPDEMEAMKASVLRSFELIPQNAYVGLITYCQNVQVFELAFSHFPKAVVINGEKDVTASQVQQLLNVGVIASMPNAKPQPTPKNRFILPLAEVEFTLTSIIEELQRDPNAVNSPADVRPPRCTGVALSVALSLLEFTFPNSGARVITISGGPATIGPGKVVDPSLKSPIRSHHHLNKEQAPYVESSTQFYSGLAQRAAASGHCVDLIACSLDQTGLLEQRNLPKMTGGVVCCSETFMNNVYKECLSKIFDKDENGELLTHFNATLTVVNSSELRICGAIGHLASAGKKSPLVSEIEVGIGGTSAWRMSVMDPHNSYAIFWEVVNHGKVIPQGQFGVIQFQTMYTNSSGVKFLRVTTVARSYIGAEQGIKALLPGFDQECCASLVTRVAVFRGESQEQAPLKWIDRQLIQMTYSCADFRKNSPDTFKMHDNYALFPVFMFHLRRGNLVQVFGNSPDEMSYYRHYALRENVANTLIMIQPSLDAYELDRAEPEPVLLTTASVKPDRLLLLDTFFHIIVYSGQTIAVWRKEGYHLQEGYENLKGLIEAPVEEANRLMTGRYPRPIYIECDHGGSQARFLLAVLDPARDEAQPAIGVAGQQQDVGFMHSEDVSLAVFMEHLKKKVVSYEA